MQATRNRRPLGPFIARCDEKGQTNRRAGSFRDEATSEPLWTPEKTRTGQTTRGAFSGSMSSRAAKSFADYGDPPRTFDRRCGDIATLLGDNDNPPTHIHASKMPRPRFFPSAHLNFAENVRPCDGAGAALVFRGKEVKRHLRRADRCPKERGPPSGDRQRARHRLNRCRLILPLARLPGTDQPSKPRSPVARQRRRQRAAPSY